MQQFIRRIGFSNRFKLNGLDGTAPNDTTGPLFHSSWTAGTSEAAITWNQNTKIIADLFDVSGINLTGALDIKLKA